MDQTREITSSRWQPWLSAAGLLCVSFIAIAALSLRIRPEVDVVAIAFPPWWSSEQVFSATASAEAAIVRTTAIAFILVVRPNDHDGLKRLRDAGAWLAADPQAIGACITAEKGI